MTPEQREAKRASSRAWKAANRERVRAARAAHYQENKDKEKQSHLRWIEANRERLRETKRKGDAAYRRANAAALRAKRRSPEYRAAQNARARKRYQTDPLYAITCKLRASFSQALRLAGVRKSRSVMTLIGCSPQQLKSHLEAQFLAGMSWDRRREIHIDHVRPCASFDLSDPERQRQCFHFTNLRPLWAFDNQSKGAKMPH